MSMSIMTNICKVMEIGGAILKFPVNLPDRGFSHNEDEYDQHEYQYHGDHMQGH